MKLSDFNFEIPESLLAQYPNDNRDESRLLVLDRKNGDIQHLSFKEIINFFDEEDVLVLNNTKVFPARLYGNKEKTGARIEVFLLRELNQEQRLWDVLVDPARKIRIGNKLYFGEDESLVAEVIDNTTSRGRTLRFLFDGPYEDFKAKITELGETPLPKYIAIEGPIGVGKTTLANKIAANFNYDTFLEKPSENPFLNNFYKNPSQSALATQLFFLFQRMQQIEELKQRSLFETVRVADFLIQKDRLFAEVTLSNEEMDLYNKIYDHLTIDAPTPDLVIYLQAPVDVLLDRISKRGNPNEQFLTSEYLEKLNDAYSRFFLYYESSPLLIVNAADINLESNDNDFEMLVTQIMSDPKGKKFINPQPSII